MCLAIISIQVLCNWHASAFKLNVKLTCNLFLHVLLLLLLFMYLSVSVCQDKLPLKVICLSNFVVTKASDVDRDHAFKLSKYEQKTFCFAAKNEEEMSSWASVITSAAETRSKVGVVTGGFNICLGDLRQIEISFARVRIDDVYENFLLLYIHVFSLRMNSKHW